jgi:hypothetical protein
LKIEGIQPDEINIGDINTSFFDGFLQDHQMVTDEYADSSESEDMMKSTI